MIESLARHFIAVAWIAGLTGSWRMFRYHVLPVALDRCPWGQES